MSNPNTIPIYSISFLLILLSFSYIVSSSSHHEKVHHLHSRGPRVIESKTTSVERVCQHAPYFRLCMTSLQSDPRSKDASPPLITSITVKKTITKAMQISSYIDRIIKGSNQERPVVLSLYVCQARYSDVIAKLSDWLSHVGVDADHLAKRWVKSALKDVEVCEAAFNARSGMVNPIAHSNKEMMMMIRNTMWILKAYAPNTKE